MEVLVIWTVACGAYWWWSTRTAKGRTWAAREKAGRQARSRTGLERREARTQAPTTASCLTCGGGDVERVRMGARVVSGVLGGLVFSKKARAQFHCRTCSYYW